MFLIHLIMTFKNKISQILMSLLFAAGLINAQSPGPLRAISTSHGLSQNSVYSIVQDKSGLIWIGTKDGLNRFDGYAFKIYRKNPFDSLSLSDNWIQSLLVDSNDNLWIGTFSGGLNYFDKRLNQFKQLGQPAGINNSKRILSLHAGQDDKIWSVAQRVFILLKAMIFHFKR